MSACIPSLIYLPFEVKTNIVRFLERAAHVRSLSLVHSSLTEECQARLFRRITVHGYYGILPSILKSGALLSVGKHVHVLLLDYSSYLTSFQQETHPSTVKRNAVFTDRSTDAFPELLLLLPRLRKLSIIFPDVPLTGRGEGENRAGKNTQQCDKLYRCIIDSLSVLRMPLRVFHVRSNTRIYDELLFPFVLSAVLAGHVTLAPFSPHVTHLHLRSLSSAGERSAQEAALGLFLASMRKLLSLKIESTPLPARIIASNLPQQLQAIEFVIEGGCRQVLGFLRRLATTQHRLKHMRLISDFSEARPIAPNTKPVVLMHLETMVFEITGPVTVGITSLIACIIPVQADNLKHLTITFNGGAMVDALVALKIRDALHLKTGLPALQEVNLVVETSNP
ncbi:hypothetical protein EMMF5_005520 [Cystobasidiomycetes sp. EMM_F5]